MYIHVTEHAVRRFIQRYEPGMPWDLARKRVIQLAQLASYTGEARKGAQVWRYADMPFLISRLPRRRHGGLV